MFSCHVHELKYVKCNKPHKVEYYYDLAWYCKVNFKTNLSWLKTKEGKLCLHSFKYINYKNNHQADSNISVLETQVQ